MTSKTMFDLWDESIQSLSFQKGYCQSCVLAALVSYSVAIPLLDNQKYHHALPLENPHSANIVLSFVDSLPYQAPCFECIPVIGESIWQHQWKYGNLLCLLLTILFPLEKPHCSQKYDVPFVRHPIRCNPPRSKNCSLSATWCTFH